MSRARRPTARAAPIVAAALVAALLGLLLPAPVAAAPEFVGFYKNGLEAAERGDWALAERMMRRAIALEPQAKKRQRIGVRFTGYVPHYHLGRALYHQGDCAGALAAWAASERQGVIVGRTDDHLELARLRAECERKVPAARSDPAEPPTPAVAENEPPPAAEPEPEPEDKPTMKERIRRGQRRLERGSEPAQKVVSRVGDQAPEGSQLGRAADQAGRALDAGTRIGDLVDAALPPREALSRAVDAYFGGDPARTLELLAGIELEDDPRARAQLHLFRAAASFRLHRLDGEPARLEAARRHAARFRAAEWSDDFVPELFDPRFVRFLEDGG